MPTPRLPFPTTPSEYIQAPTGGWSPDVPTWELPTDAAPQLENFQIRPGKIRVRPSFAAIANISAAGGSLAGWLVLNASDRILTNRLFMSGFPWEPQNLQRVGQSALTSQRPGGDTYYDVNLGGTVTKYTMVTVGTAPGGRALQLGSSVYAYTYSAPSYAVMPWAGSAGILMWKRTLVNITALGATNPVTGAPVGGIDLYQNLNRVWVLGGLAASGGTNPGLSTNLFFTNPLSDLAGTIADWEDPVSGLYNQIQIDNNYDDPGIALASVPAGIIILRQNSVFILRGTDPTSYTIRSVSKQTGCLDQRSVVETNNRVYFMSAQGFMVTDGTTVQNVSGALQDELYRQIAKWNNAVYHSTGAWCSCVLLSDNTLLVSFGSYGAGSAGVGYPAVSSLSAVFDPSTGAWVRVSSTLDGIGSALGPCISGYGIVTAMGNSNVIVVENATNNKPITASSSLHDVALSGAFTPITATWTTKSPQAALGGRQKIQIKTTYLDYACSTGGPAATVAYQLTDRVTGGTLTTNSITASTNASDPRQYLERDEFHEVSDLGITVTLAGTNTTGAASVPKAEVHGIGLVFSGAADMRPIV